MCVCVCVCVSMPECVCVCVPLLTSLLCALPRGCGGAVDGGRRRGGVLSRERESERSPLLMPVPSAESSVWAVFILHSLPIPKKAPAKPRRPSLSQWAGFGLSRLSSIGPSLRTRHRAHK